MQVKSGSSGLMYVQLKAIVTDSIAHVVNCQVITLTFILKVLSLTLKMPRKPASENVVCLCCLLNILANFSNLFLHTGKQCGP